jgi:hypothetical protein
LQKSCHVTRFVLAVTEDATKQLKLGQARPAPVRPLVEEGLVDLLPRVVPDDVDGADGERCGGARAVAAVQGREGSIPWRGRSPSALMSAS